MKQDVEDVLECSKFEWTRGMKSFIFTIVILLL